jgi:hypothetical protein
VAIDIDALTGSELIDLNFRIAARLQFLRHLEAHATMLEFRIGERVTFHPDGRPPVTGMIARYSEQTVRIVTDDGHRWNVVPQFLERAAPRSASRPGAGNVVPIQRNDKPSRCRLWESSASRVPAAPAGCPQSAGHPDRGPPERRQPRPAHHGREGSHVAPAAGAAVAAAPAFTDLCSARQKPRIRRCAAA